MGANSFNWRFPGTNSRRSGGKRVGDHQGGVTKETCLVGVAARCSQGSQREKIKRL